MRYVTSIERIAAERGWREGWCEGWSKGWSEGRREESSRGILRVLALRFDYVSEPFHQRLDTVDDWAQRDALFRHAVLAPTLNDFHSAADAILETPRDAATPR